MARDVTPIEALERLEKDFRDVADRLAETIRLSREAGMDAVLIHLKTLRNKHLPEVVAWSEGTELDVKEQVRAFAAGLKSRAEMQIEKAQKNKEKLNQPKPAKRSK